MKRAILFPGLVAAVAGGTAFAATAQQETRPPDMPAPAAAPDQSAPRAQWMSVADLAAKLREQGYTVREIATEDGAYQVEMTDTNGMRIRTYLDPVSGEPVSDRLRERERDDDRYARRDDDDRSAGRDDDDHGRGEDERGRDDDDGQRGRDGDSD